MKNLIAAAKATAAKPSTAPSFIVQARAGTGKTFTLLYGVGYCVAHSKGGKPQVWKELMRKEKLTPSPQQKTVWEAMAAMDCPTSITYTAFNNSIVDDFSAKYAWFAQMLQSYGIVFNFSTLHKLGNAACQKQHKAPLDKWKIRNIISRITGKDCNELLKSNSGAVLLRATEELANLARLSLSSLEEESLAALAVQYGIETNGQSQKIFGLVAEVVEACKVNTECVDFTDMVWLPVVGRYPIYKSDLLLVDEAQDLNKCQQHLALQAGRRIVLCGDNRQAIYGFAGADCDSLPSMQKQLACDTYPLTVTRRCAKVVVELAKQIVPDFEAHTANAEGTISSISEENLVAAVKPSDMVVCRTNAPLVQACFALLKAKRKATIQGRNIGQGLVSLIKKIGATTLGNLQTKLNTWFDQELAKIKKRRHVDEGAVIALQDKLACLVMFCEETPPLAGNKEATPADVVNFINSIFSDTQPTNSVLLSSIHRAKGMESDRVFFLRPELCPHPMAKTAEAQQQEQNLRYVAITRAKTHLVMVENKLQK